MIDGESTTRLSSRLMKVLPTQYQRGKEPPKGRRPRNPTYRYQGFLKSPPLFSSPVRRKVRHKMSHQVLGPTTKQPATTSRHYSSTWKR